MDVVRRHRVVLVEIERHDVPEAQSLFLVHPDQLPVHTDRRRAGGEAEHGACARRVLLADQRRDARRDDVGDVLVLVEHERRDALALDGMLNETRRPANRRAIAGLDLGADVLVGASDR